MINKLSTIVTKKELDQQLALLNLRREATKLAVYLFENVKTQDHILEISDLLEECNLSQTASVIRNAISQMKQFAASNGITLKEEL